MSADGYALTVCSCDGGPYLGARKAGTPCCCEVCGFITADQLAAIAEALGSSDDGVPEISYSSPQYGIRTPDGQIRSVAIGPAEAERYRAANVDIHVRQQTAYLDRVTDWQPLTALTGPTP